MTDRRTRTRRLNALLAASIAPLALMAVACGGSDDDTASKDSDSRETTTTAKAGSGVASGILEKASQSGQFDASDFDEDLEECVGESVIDSLGESEAEAMVEIEVSDYTTDQIDALAVAFNDCVPGQVIAPMLVSSFYEGMGAVEPSDPTMVDCVAAFVDGRTGDIVREGAAAQATDAVPEVTIQAFDQCMPPEDITALLKDAFLTSGLSEEQATCVSTALEGQLSVADLAAAGMDQQSPELEAKLQAAAQGCQ